MTAQLTQTAPDKTRFIQRVLYGNATFSIVTGSLFAFAASAVTSVLGLTGTALGSIGTPTIIAGVGIATLGFAAYVLYTTRLPVRRALLWTVIALDLTWVIGSYALLLARVVPLSRGGAWTLLIIADIVLVFAILQTIGVRRLR